AGGELIDLFRRTRGDSGGRQRPPNGHVSSLKVAAGLDRDRADRQPHNACAVVFLAPRSPEVRNRSEVHAKAGGEVPADDVVVRGCGRDGRVAVEEVSYVAEHGHMLVVADVEVRAQSQVDVNPAADVQPVRQVGVYAGRRITAIAHVAGAKIRADAGAFIGRAQHAAPVRYQESCRRAQVAGALDRDYAIVDDEGVDVVCQRP